MSSNVIYKKGHENKQLFVTIKRLYKNMCCGLYNNYVKSKVKLLIGALKTHTE